MNGIMNNNNGLDVLDTEGKEIVIEKYHLELNELNQKLLNKQKYIVELENENKELIAKDRGNQYIIQK